MTQLKKHENFQILLGDVDHKSVFVEIGSERGEGSTLFLSNLAKKYNVDFLTVDIDDKTNITDITKRQWEVFYKDVRDVSWPVEISSIVELSTERQQECINLHKWNEINQQEIKKMQNLYFQDHVIFYNDPGSDWSKNYKENINRPISLLYLDNYDYIWNINDVPEMLEQYITEYQTKWNINLNNQQCQVEHFTQLMNLEPFLTDNCIIGFDDTYCLNDCWVGKNGPGVVYLLSKGYKIILISEMSVFLKKG